MIVFHDINYFKHCKTYILEIIKLKTLPEMLGVDIFIIIQSTLLVDSSGILYKYEIFICVNTVQNLPIIEYKKIFSRWWQY